MSLKIFTVISKIQHPRRSKGRHLSHFASKSVSLASSVIQERIKAQKFVGLYFTYYPRRRSDPITAKVCLRDILRMKSTLPNFLRSYIYFLANKDVQFHWCLHLLNDVTAVISPDNVMYYKYNVLI